MSKLEQVINSIPKVNYAIDKETQMHLDFLTKPQGSLGRLEEIAKQVVRITGNSKPSLKNKIIFTMAADHGVVQEGVSAYPKEVTPQMVYNFVNGGAGINVLARHVGARVVVADVGVAIDLENKSGLYISKIGYGTKSIAKGPAMTREEAIRSLEAGINIFESEFVKGVDLVGTGDMGIGNTTPSSAIVSVITQQPVEKITGKGTGIDNQGLKTKILVIKKAIELNKPTADDGLDVLAKVGGFEIGAIAGVILAACAKRIPVVIDGFISGAAALIALKLQPNIKDYLFAGHCSVEQGHKITLDFMGLKPILDLDLRLGEGTGACLAMSVIEASVKILNEMATFQSAGVSEKI